MSKTTNQRKTARLLADWEAEAQAARMEMLAKESAATAARQRYSRAEEALSAARERMERTKAREEKQP